MSNKVNNKTNMSGDDDAPEAVSFKASRQQSEKIIKEMKNYEKM